MQSYKATVPKAVMKVVENQFGKTNSVPAEPLPSSIPSWRQDHPALVKTLSNMGWLMFDRVLRMGVGLLVGAWVARYLGPAGFGHLSYAMAFVGLFSPIAGLGLNGVVVRDMVRDPQSADLTIGSAFVMQSFAGISAVCLTIISITLLKPDDALVRMIVTILSLALMLNGTHVIKYWYEARVQSRPVVWVENTAFLLMTVFRILMLLTGASLVSFAWLILVEALITSIGMMLIYKADRGLSKLFQASLSRVKGLMSDSWPLLLSAVAVTLYMRVDLIMLEEMSTQREVGIYAAATRLSEIWYFLPTIIISSVSPSIISCHRTNYDLYLRRIKGLYFIMSWLALGISLPISLFSAPIVTTLFGPEYKDSAPVLAIHLWASVAVFLGMASSQHLLVADLQKISFYRTIIGLFFNVLLNLILIPSMGAKGAAIATVISYFTATFSLIFFRATRSHSMYLLMSPIVRK